MTRSLAAALLFALSAVAQVRVIEADFTRVKGPHDDTYRKCIGAGRANEGLRADWQEQLKLVQKEIGFEYIRMHALLHDDMGVYAEDAKGTPIYNWQYIDALYDRLLELGLRPFVELAFMPRALASGPATIFWWKGNITPPKSYEKWGELVRNLVAHFQERYGEEEVRKWYFEVWNEPDIAPFWTGTMEDYFKLYRASAQAVKSVSSAYRVGGPASAVAYKFEEELVKWCAATGTPIDFVATHAYGVLEGYVDETGRKGTVLDPDPTAVRSRMVESRKLIQKSALPKIELHFTEWSSAYTPTDYIHDQYHQASFILDKVKGAEGALDSLAYWVFTDIFEENGPRTTPFHGGFGLLNYQGIKKPAYHAFRFMRRLGDQDLENSDAASWVTKDSRGGVQALFWDFTPIKPPGEMNDQVYYREIRPAKEKGAVKLRIANAPAGRYWVRVFRTGFHHNDPYTMYVEMGAPNQLTRAQAKALRQASDGAPASEEMIEHGGGAFERTFPMRENDVVLVTLDRL